jgi:probable HAF family extracellular repeat protein
MLNVRRLPCLGCGDRYVASWVLALLAAGCGGSPTDTAAVDQVSTVSVAPSVVSMGIDGRTLLNAMAWTERGLPATSVGFKWASTNDSVASVTTEGLVVGRAEGTASITVQVGDISGFASIRVVPVIHLGALDGEQLFPRGISSDGSLVVGRTIDPPPVGDTSSRDQPFIVGKNRRVVKLELLAGNLSGQASGVSSSGVVIGISGSDYLSARAVIWQRLGDSWKVTSLPWTGSGSFGTAISTNSVYAVGVLFIQLGEREHGGYPGRWHLQPDGARMVERLPVPEGLFGEAYGVNDAGDVVGSYGHPRSGFQPALWQKTQAGSWTIVPLGSPSIEESKAHSINNAGVVVGQRQNLPVMWTQVAGVWVERFLGTDKGWAAAINEAGTVAGAIEDQAGTQHAFRWDDRAGMTLLPSAVSQNAAAFAISGAGHVIGVSYDPRSFLSSVGSLWFWR